MKQGKKIRLVVCLCFVLCIGAVLLLSRKKEEPSLEEMTRWDGPSSCAVGDLNYYLPEGCSQEQVEVLELKDREMLKYLEAKEGIYPYAEVFRQGEIVVGGINSYFLPESFDPTNLEWIKTLGLWEFEDESLGYFAGSGIGYDWEIEFFTDLPGDSTDKVLRKHYFFLSEDMSMVRDLWFDMMTVDEGICRQILDSCVVGGGRHREVAMPQSSSETETFPVKETLASAGLDSRETALQRCRSVLEQVQSCSRSLRCERDNGYDNGIMEYWLHEEDWMTIQSHSDGSVIGFLYKDGIYYDNSGMMGNQIGIRDEEGNLLWKESVQRETFHIPWLSQYQWKKDTVDYLTTERKNGENHIRLRIREPFPGFEWGNPQYDVTMVFDDDHTFLQAELSVNQGHSSQSAFTEKETIVSLVSETVAAQMEEKSQNINS